MAVQTKAKAKKQPQSQDEIARSLWERGMEWLGWLIAREQ